MHILAISPHTDDVELGCGGSLARLSFEQHTTKVLALGTGNPLGGATSKEFESAVRTLGVRSWYLHNFDCRVYNERRQDILQLMVLENRQKEPDIVFVPSTASVHQDHEVVTAEALRAFKTSCILGYELPWGDRKQAHFPFYITLGAGDLIKKCEAVACYKSQAKRGYTSEDFLYSLATVRGIQTGKGKFAEAFEVLRWVL